MTFIVLPTRQFDAAYRSLFLIWDRQFVKIVRSGQSQRVGHCLGDFALRDRRHYRWIGFSLGRTLIPTYADLSCFYAPNYYLYRVRGTLNPVPGNARHNDLSNRLFVDETTIDLQDHVNIRLTGLLLYRPNVHTMSCRIVYQRAHTYSCP